MAVKVYELAKEFKMTNSEMVKKLTGLGFKKIGPMDDLEDAVAEQARTQLLAGDGAPTAETNGKNGRASAAKTPRASKAGVANAKSADASAEEAAADTPAAADPADIVEVSENISVKDLADRLVVSAAEIQKVLMGMGVLAAVNQRLAGDAVHRIAQKMGRNVKIITAAMAARDAAAASDAAGGGRATGAGEAATEPDAAAGPRTAGVSPRVATARRTPARQSAAVAVKGKGGSALVPRPPVVTIMGHVDHGKTTLLDALRQSAVAEGEAGGITQHIGAYQIERDGKRITFLDTPGHAAFSSMRARGAQVTDIVVIVVAADDGVMPQTEEAIRLTREANVPMVVAVNKIDLPDAHPDRVLTELVNHEVIPEAYGGDTLVVNVSAKKGEGLEELIETLLIVAEVEVDPKADPHGKAQGTVIEAKLEKGRGAVVTVLVQQGTLRQSDAVVAGEHFGKIRSMADERGSKLLKAGPSTPVEIIGFDGIPMAGDRLEVVKNEREARAIADKRGDRAREDRLAERNNVSLEELYRTLREGAAKELNVVVKADVQGSVQAVQQALEELGNDEARVRVLSAGVGAISENDIMLASSDTDADERNSLIVGFNVAPANGVERRAEQQHVRVETFTIIYELIDAVREALIGLLDPVYEEAELGKAEVRALFRLPGGGVIAGCYVTDGLVRRNAKVRVRRGRDIVHIGDIATLRRLKDDAREVQTGYECGLTVRDYNGIQEGDLLEVFEMRELPREL